MPDVIIIGGGPVGLGLAIDLALKGVASTVLERSTELHRIPKGQNLTQRAGECFRAWGVSKAIRDASPIPPEFGNAGLVTYGTLFSDYHYDWFQRSKVGAYYFAANERLPQYATEKVLRRRAAELDQITLLTGTKVTDIAQDDNLVTVTYEVDGGPVAISAPYAVGCDGARSKTRDLVGIESDTDHEGPRMALLVFRSMELHDLLERHPGKSIFNVMNPAMDGYWQFLGRVDLDGGWFFHSPVPEGTTREKFDFKTFLYEMAGRKFALEFEHIGFWDLRITQAKDYRKARVFIAGDACHSHPPYGGYGVNTGLEDACNLSWKLDAKLKGWGGEALLDSYRAERHPVFKSVNEDFISRMIDDFREFTAAVSPERNLEAFEAAWQARTQADDSDVTQFLPHYGGSPIVFGQPGAKSGAKGVHEVTARPGYHLAPQPLPGGRDLWDEMGEGFTLVDLTGDAELVKTFAGAADALGIPFKGLDLTQAGLADAYGAKAILVRPDLFVAWTDGAGGKNPREILARAIGAEGG